MNGANNMTDILLHTVKIAECGCLFAEIGSRFSPCAKLVRPCEAHNAQPSPTNELKEDECWYDASYSYGLRAALIDALHMASLEHADKITLKNISVAQIQSALRLHLSDK
jgi:hypothetical protein